MAVGCLPQILADQITDICRDTCQGCGFRAAVQFDPAHVLLALQHPEDSNHILTTHHLVVFQTVLIDLVDGHNEIIDHLYHRRAQLHRDAILLAVHLGQDALEQLLIQTFQTFQQVAEAAVFFCGFGHIILQHIRQQEHIASAQFYTIDAVGSLHELVGFIDDEVIAVLQQVCLTAGFQLLRHQQHIVVGHLNVIGATGLAEPHVLIVLAHDPLRTITATGTDTDLLLHIVGDIHFVQIETMVGKIQGIQHIDLALVLVRVLPQVTHQAEVATHTEVMFLSFTDNNTQRTVDDTYAHQSIGELGNLLFHQFSLEVNAGGCDGNGILHVLVDGFRPGHQECGNQVSHGLAGTNTCFEQGDFLFAQTFQHGLCHLDLLLPDCEPQLRHDTTEDHIHQILLLDITLNLHGPGMSILIAEGIHHEGNQQRVVLFAVENSAIQDTALDPGCLIEHMVLGIDARHAMENHIAVHQCKVIVISHTHQTFQRKGAESHSIFSIHFKHSHSPYLL